MSNKSLKELKTLILNDMECCKSFRESFEGNENPQVKEMYNRNKNRIEALEDVLRYINDGSKYQFDKKEE